MVFFRGAYKYSRFVAPAGRGVGGRENFRCCFAVYGAGGSGQTNTIPIDVNLTPAQSETAVHGGLEIPRQPLPINESVQRVRVIVVHEDPGSQGSVTMPMARSATGPNRILKAARKSGDARRWAGHCRPTYGVAFKGTRATAGWASRQPDRQPLPGTGTGRLSPAGHSRKTAALQPNRPRNARNCTIEGARSFSFVSVPACAGMSTPLKKRQTTAD